MVSYGDDIYINDLGEERNLIDKDCVDEETKEKLIPVQLVEECDGSINWYLNPNREDEILITRWIMLL